MRRTHRGWWFAWAMLASGMPAHRVLAGGDAPRDPPEAMSMAGTLIEPLRKAEAVKNKDSKEHKAIAEPLRAALEALKGQSKEGFRRPDFQALWNEVVSLANFHGLKGVPGYQLKPRAMTAYPIRMGLPVGRGWSFRELRPGMDDQLWGEIQKTLPGERLVRHVKIWIYKWTTVYSDIGGENAKGLAENDLEGDILSLQRVAFRSQRVVTARMGRGFPKTSYYEIVGEDEKLGPVRRRNYYVKGKATTFNFEVIELRKTEAADDPWTRWQCEGEDPELDAVLESLEEVETKGK